jgi:hypothetical protein
MQLYLRREQESTSTGARFTLHCRLDLTAEEMALLRKYGAPMLETIEWLKPPKLAAWRRLVKGHSERSSNVTEIMGKEAELFKAVHSMPGYFDLAQAYGGEETVDVAGDTEGEGWGGLPDFGG